MDTSGLIVVNQWLIVALNINGLFMGSNGIYD